MCGPNPQAALANMVNQATGGAPTPPGVAPFYAGQTPQPGGPIGQRYLPQPGEPWQRWTATSRNMDDAVNGAVNNDSALASVFGRAQR